MIAINNYYTEIEKVNATGLPETLQKGRTFVNKVTDHGTSWKAYHSSDSIKKTVDLYLSKLNEYQKANAKPEKKNLAPGKAKPKTAQTTKPKVSAKTVKQQPERTKEGTSKPKSKKSKKVSAREWAYRKAQKVERIRDELKMIKRFVLMHHKVKTQNQIRLFLNTLQKAIMEKRIRKTSEYAQEIKGIQDSLIKLMAKFKNAGNIKVEICESKRSHYLTLVGKQAELRSVKFIKSYIHLQGKSIENIKAKNLHNRIAKAINNGTLSKHDRYYKEVEKIVSILKSFVKKNAQQGELVVSSKELNGLQEIVTGCASDALNGTSQVPRNTIMSSTDIVNLNFCKLGFKGKWRNLIGDPSSGFTAMIFGKPKMGKSYLAVDFAGYLARNHGTVLYVAREEGIDDTLQQKLKDKQVAHPDLYVSDFLPDDLSQYDFVFLDSVNKLGLSPRDLDELKRKYPEASFIHIFQTTKLGNFRGGNEFQHDVDVVIEVPEKGKAIQFGRFNQGGAINIFGW